MWVFRATKKVPATLIREGYTHNEIIETAATAWLESQLEEEEIANRTPRK